MASDGRYYPPQSAPGAQSHDPYAQVRSQGQYAQPQQGYPPAGQPPGQYGPGQYPPQPAPYPQGRPARSGGRGCLTAIVVVVVLVLGLGLAGWWAVGRAGTWLGEKKDNLVGGTGCPFISDTEVSSLVGGEVTLVRAGSLTSVVSTAVDGRVIPAAPSCWAVPDGAPSVQNPGRLMRIADQEGVDAATVFTSEATKAKAGTAENGDGTGRPYYGKAVRGLGDEAFCTTASVGTLSAGVLVREGARLVYVSLTPDFSKAVPRATPGRPALPGNDDSCAMAQKIARAVLTR